MPSGKGTSPVIVEEIRRLSQEEGLKDCEIADTIQYDRVSIQRIRKAHNIPTYNIKVRKDKKVTCPQCGNTYLIRRNEKPGICCPDCEKVFNEILSSKARKRKKVTANVDTRSSVV
jgi:transposase-like protein